MNNRRRFFEKYAAEQGFDPLAPDNWYTIRVDALDYRKVIYNNTPDCNILTLRQGGNTLKGLYNGSMIAALLHVFPELPWDEAKFGNLRSKSRERCIRGTRRGEGKRRRGAGGEER